MLSSRSIDICAALKLNGKSVVARTRPIAFARRNRCGLSFQACLMGVQVTAKEQRRA
jgi:hypothetical protein